MVLAVGIGIGMSYAIRPGASKPFDTTSAAQAACLAKTASLVKTSLYVPSHDAWHATSGSLKFLFNPSKSNLLL